MPCRILIVEDEPLIALDLDATLEDAGYKVVGIAPDMHRALEIAAEEPLDVAIMDIELASGTNGVETAKRLRQTYNVSSLFVSARITERDRALALEWQPLGFIGKPYQGADIVQTLRQALASKG